MTPESTIRQLLKGFTDARSPLVRGTGGEGGGSGPSMSSTWHAGSYEELERALKEMKALGKQQAVSGIPLGTLWWHLAQRYLMSERKAVWKVGFRTVDSMVRQRRCICEFRFFNPEQARKHIEAVHKPKPELTTVYPEDYRLLLRDQPGLCGLYERLAVRWVGGWFFRHGITPHLPRANRTDTEEWLRKNDPIYQTKSEAWRHLRRTGAYERPRQEIPWGLAGDLEQIVEAGRASDDRRGPKVRGYVGTVERRICEQGGEAFIPKNSWNRFCSPSCRWRSNYIKRCK